MKITCLNCGFNQDHPPPPPPLLYILRLPPNISVFVLSLHQYSYMLHEGEGLSYEGVALSIDVGGAEHGGVRKLIP